MSHWVRWDSVCFGATVELVGPLAHSNRAGLWDTIGAGLASVGLDGGRGNARRCMNQLSRLAA